MSQAYRTVRPSGALTRSIDDKEILKLATRYMRPRGPEWRMKARGEPWGRWREDWQQTRTRFSERLKFARAGDILTLDGKHGAYAMSVRIVDTQPPTVQTEGNLDVDKIHTWMKHHHGNFDSGGICNRRPILGTNTWTQHCPWPEQPRVGKGSNAEDFFFDTMDQEYDVASDMVRNATGPDGELPVGYLIVGDRDWSRTNGWGGYGGEFHYHIHAEGYSEIGGTPRASCP